MHHLCIVELHSRLTPPVVGIQKLKMMTKKRNAISVFSMIAVAIVLTLSAGCKEEVIDPRDTTYTLKVEDVLGVSGTVTFTEVSSSATTIDITMTGVPAGNHPAQLCMNSAIEGGPVVIVLNPVDANGKSSTTVSNMTYSTLIEYNGYIQVIKSDEESNVILAKGDIGGNVITNINKSYPLSTVGTYGVTGNVLLEKRLNGNTLMTITLTGLLEGDFYPASMNLGSIQSIGGGPVVLTLGFINGTTGIGYTNIKSLNSGVQCTYDNLLVYDGYINIYQAIDASGIIISQGNIGSN